MSNWSKLKAAVANVIKENGNQEITGNALQNTLLSIINSLGANYQFVGIANKETNPGRPDGNVFYIATRGTYPNFSGLGVNASLGVLTWKDNKWAVTDIIINAVTEAPIDNNIYGRKNGHWEEINVGSGGVVVSGGVGKADPNSDGTGEIFNSYEEAYKNKATGNYSHAEGQNTEASGDYCHAEGIYTRATGSACHAEGQNSQAYRNSSHAEGYDTLASGNYCHAEGNDTEASGETSHAEGHHCIARGEKGSHAEGYSCIAQGDYGSHAEGQNTVASRQSSHAEGLGSRAENTAAHAEGIRTTASGNGSHSSGAETKAENCREFVIGQYNELDASPSPNDFNSTKPAFVIGNGSSSAQGNAFKVLFNGQTFADGEYSSAGADYAEMFEWKDGNPLNEDRVGRFVTLKGKNIEVADETSNYILGIVSGAPTIIGDNPMRWHNKYANDEWGRPIYEDVEVAYTEPETQSDGTVKEIQKTRIDRVRKLNPLYNLQEKYIPRAERKEWDFIGMMGKLLVRQDGTLTEGGFCKSSTGGIATKADKGYYVMEVISDSQALILFK